MLLKLSIVIASTRPGRIGEPVGRWLHEEALVHDAFEPELVDLAEVGLPPLDEPDHPRNGRYTKDHTRPWSERVRAADAFVFVIPECNHRPAPALTNALAFLYAEWAHKATGLVSYGGVSAGTRAAEATKQILITLRLVVPPEAVHIPFVGDAIVEGRLVPTLSTRKEQLSCLTTWRGYRTPWRRCARRSQLGGRGRTTSFMASAPIRRGPHQRMLGR
jgi:NAD(P)H-dependent FMN reductase